MEAGTRVEYKEMLILNNRLLTLEKLVIDYRSRVKSLKVCLKLIKTEKKAVKKSKIPERVTDLHTIQWRYGEFIAIVKRVIKARKVTPLNKALADLDRLKNITENEIKELNEKLAREEGGENSNGEVDGSKKPSAGNEN